MITRGAFIEQMLRDAYGTQPNDDASLTYNLVNVWVNEGIGLAVKQNWKDSYQLEGAGYINNSFYLTLKSLAVVPDETFLYKITLPEIPYALGKNEGIDSLIFKDSLQRLSADAIPLSSSQVSYAYQMREIPNKLLYWQESQFIYCRTTIPLNNYTATIRLISGGDSTNLDSVLNVPSDYLPVISGYVSKMLLLQRQQAKVQQTNDGVEN